MRVFCAIFWGLNIHLCYSLRFFHLWCRVPHNLMQFVCLTYCVQCVYAVQRSAVGITFICILCAVCKFQLVQNNSAAAAAPERKNFPVLAKQRFIIFQQTVILRIISENLTKPKSVIILLQYQYSSVILRYKTNTYNDITDI